MKLNTFMFSLILTTLSLSPLLAEKGVANISGTSDDSNLTGVVHLKDTKKGLKIEAHFKNVPPGKHGFHIHERGSCEEEGRAAGGHFNPKDKQHGHVTEDGLNKSHVGDLGNLEINEKGEGSLEAVIKGVSLSSGKITVAGRAFIVHEKPDDFGQPTGNAGGRIGCGAIIINGN